MRTALSTPGLFRQDVEQREVAELRTKVEATYAQRTSLVLGALTHNPHAAAALLLMYLRELPAPLTTFELYPYFLACGGSEGSAIMKLQQLADLLGRLPTASLRCLSLVLTLLHDTTVQNATMKAHDLARIFAPLLLQRAHDATAPSTDEAARAESVCALMISNGAVDGALLASLGSIDISDGTAAALDQKMSGLAVGVGAADPNIEWYYIDAQQNYVGPVDARGLRQLRKHSYVHGETYVWAEVLDGWKKLDEIAELKEPSRPPLMQHSSSVAPAVSLPTAPVLPPSQPAASQAPAPAPAPAAALKPVPVPAGSTAPVAPKSRPAVQQAPAHAPQRDVAPPPTLGSRTKPAPAAGGAGGIAPPSLGIARKRQGGNVSEPAAPSPAPAAPTTTMAPKAPTPTAATAAMMAGGAGHAAATPSPHHAAAAPTPPEPSSSNGDSKSSIYIPEPAMTAWDGEWDERKGMRILYGNERRVRAVIAEDGEVTDGNGRTLAYIEVNGEVGSAQMEYVGVAHLQAHQVIDHTDHTVGEFDPGRGYVKDSMGSVIAELTKEGTITDNGGQSIGRIEGFSYSHMATLAAYFLLVDPKLTRGR